MEDTSNLEYLIRNVADEDIDKVKEAIRKVAIKYGLNVEVRVLKVLENEEEA